MAGITQKNLFITYFREVQFGFSRFYSLMLTRADLSLPQFTLLNLIYHCGPSPMSDAGKKLGISKPAVTYLVDRLEESGFVKRTPHESDRRIILIELRPRAEKVVQKIQDSVLKMLFAAMHGMKVSEKEAVTDFYKGLSEQMRRCCCEDEGK